MDNSHLKNGHETILNGRQTARGETLSLVIDAKLAKAMLDMVDNNETGNLPDLAGNLMHMTHPLEHDSETSYCTPPTDMTVSSNLVGFSEEELLGLGLNRQQIAFLDKIPSDDKVKKALSPVYDGPDNGIYVFFRSKLQEIISGSRDPVVVSPPQLTSPVNGRA